MKNDNIYNIKRYIVAENNETGQIWYFTNFNKFYYAVYDINEWTTHEEYFHTEEICNSFVDPIKISK